MSYLTLDDTVDRLSYLKQVDVHSYDGGNRVRIDKDSGDRYSFVVENDDPLKGEDTFGMSAEMWTAAATGAGLSDALAKRVPVETAAPLVEWHYKDRAPKFNVFTSNGVGFDVSFPRHPTVNAFDMVDALFGAVKKEGSDALVGSVFTQGLDDVVVGFVQPDMDFSVKSRGVGDVIRAGVLASFSPSGRRKTKIWTYIDRLVCMNGMTVTYSQSEWVASDNVGGNVYDWAVEQVPTALLQARGFFPAAQRMADTAVPEDHVVDVATDMFNEARLPAPLRTLVMDRLADQNNFTLWDITNAITHVATHNDGIDPSARVRLMRFAGDVPSHTEVCPTCSHAVVA